MHENPSANITYVKKKRNPKDLAATRREREVEANDIHEGIPR